MSLLEPGTYRARAITGELGYTAKGDEQVAVSFEIIDQNGFRITWYGSFSAEISANAKKSPIERTFEALRTCGWQGDDISDLTGIEQNEVEVVVEINEWEGKESNRIKWVNAPGSGLALKNVMPPEAKKAFAARMKGQAIASRKALGGQSGNGGGQQQPQSKYAGGNNRQQSQQQNRQQPGRRNDPPPQEDDEIPF
jgi:hypothetical protein